MAIRIVDDDVESRLQAYAALPEVQSDKTRIAVSILRRVSELTHEQIRELLSGLAVRQVADKGDAA